MCDVFYGLCHICTSCTIFMININNNNNNKAELTLHHKNQTTGHLVQRILLPSTLKLAQCRYQQAAG